MGEAAKKEQEVNPELELDTASGDGDSNEATLHDGTKVKVHKCKLRHAAKVARAVNVILIGLGVDNLEGVESIQISNPQVLLNCLDMATDSIMDAMEALTGLSRAEVEELDIDDAILLLAKVVEVNRDFFLKRVQVALKELMPQSAASKK